MATKKKEKISTDYILDMLDNGIVLSTPLEGYSECEKYGDDNDKYKDVCQFLGREFWSEILSITEALSTSRVKVTITIEGR